MKLAELDSAMMQRRIALFAVATQKGVTHSIWYRLRLGIGDVSMRPTTLRGQARLAPPTQLYALSVNSIPQPAFDLTSVVPTVCCNARVSRAPRERQEPPGSSPEYGWVDGRLIEAM